MYRAGYTMCPMNTAAVYTNLPLPINTTINFSLIPAPLPTKAARKVEEGAMVREVVRALNALAYS